MRAYGLHIYTLSPKVTFFRPNSHHVWEKAPLGGSGAVLLCTLGPGSLLCTRGKKGEAIRASHVYGELKIRKGRLGGGGQEGEGDVMGGADSGNCVQEVPRFELVRDGQLLDQITHTSNNG